MLNRYSIKLIKINTFVSCLVQVILSMLDFVIVVVVWLFVKLFKLDHNVY